MQNRPNRSVFKPVLLLALLLATFGVQGQTITGSVATRIFHNTSATANSRMTYNIVLSNGWKKDSKVTNLTLRNAANTVVYAHTSGSSIGYGTVNNLPAGYYTFTGNVSTLDNSSKFVSVAISAEIWIGYKVEWEKCLDMLPGADQYSLKRSNVSPGLTRSFAQSFNETTSKDVWMEMSMPVTAVAGTRIFWVLEPLADPTTFTPTSNIAFIEFYYNSSADNGVNVRAINGSSVYVTTKITTIAPGDKVRFNQTAAGVATIQVNASSAAKFTFQKALNGTFKPTVLGTLVGDLVNNIAISCGYPSTNMPLSNTFADDKGTGDLTVRISTLSSAVGPYHYFVSPNPIPDLKSVYKFLKDTLGGGTLDSTTFFTGPVVPKSYTAGNVPMGNYHISAFDSRGVRIYSNAYSALSPAMTYSDLSNVVFAADEYLSTAPMSYVSPNLYLTPNTTGAAVGFTISELSAEHSFGLVIPSDAIQGGASSYAAIQYGFSILGGELYTVDKGVRTKSTIIPIKEMSLDLQYTDDGLQFLVNGSVVKTVSLPATFQFKAGIYFTQWGTWIRLKPTKLTKLAFIISKSHANNCTSSTVNLAFFFPTTTFHNQAIVSRSLQLYTTTSPATAVGTLNQTGFPSLAPGVYLLSGSVAVGNPAVSYPYSQYIYAGYNTVWENEQNIYPQNTLFLQAPRTHAILKMPVSVPNTYGGQAIGSGKLAAGAAGWIAVTPVSKVSATALMNVFSLSEVPLMNQLNATASSMPIITFSSAGGILTINNPVNQSMQLYSYSPYIPIVIQRDASGAVRLFQEGTQIANTVSSYYFGKLRPAIFIQQALTGIGEVVSSFPCNYPADTYAHLKYELDGYYHVMNNCKINFMYAEEYNSPTLTFNIYTDDMNKVFDQSHFPVVPLIQGENRISLNVSDPTHCLPGNDTYILEVINGKKERFYLRFYNATCTGCAALVEPF